MSWTYDDLPEQRRRWTRYELWKLLNEQILNATDNIFYAALVRGFLRRRANDNKD